jgi:transforming growth factor-beta-induced protein
MRRMLDPRIFCPLLMVMLLAAACGGDDDTTAASDATTTTVATSDRSSDDAATGDVLEVAAAEGDLNMFLAATEAAGVMDGLHGTGPFTVFIPTDAAFSSYLEKAGMTQAEVFADTAALRRLVDHHIVNMKDDAEMVMSMAGQSLTTAAGTELDVSVEGETVMVDDATITRYDIAATNGVIHVIDGVLVPPEA